MGFERSGERPTAGQIRSLDPTTSPDPGMPLDPADFVTRDGVRYAVIPDVDRLEPFLIHLVGNGDVWVFAGSNSPFTAGRIDPDHALFPYVTADKLLRHYDTSGALTILRVRRGATPATLWEPWRGRAADGVRRDLLKRADSTELVFEETSDRLGVRFTWSLATCDRFGVVRHVRIENLGHAPVEIEYLDGWHELVPPGVGTALWDRYSYLAAGYMRHELAPDVPLAVFALNAAITDQPEANESLRSACAWSLGHRSPSIMLTDHRLDDFRAGLPVRSDESIRGEIGAYLAVDSVAVEPGCRFDWFTVADTNLDDAALADIRGKLRDPVGLGAELLDALEENRRGLRHRIAGADAIQQTADETASVHHYTNVLYNSMRGGTFPDSYRFPVSDFRRYLSTHNGHVYLRHEDWLAGLGATIDLPTLAKSASALDDAQLDRLVSAYLPLSFSRRHGDPSRPWNRFAIRLKDESGEPILGYEGNWRDIFQNWEATGRSYPGWLHSMISVFLNASTSDGYNPYRVTKNGVEWEVPIPDDPWASIGYWGDHQLVYLARLLEAFDAYYPGRLRDELAAERFASVRVPYRIAGLEGLLSNPHGSIEFDRELHDRLLARAAELGADGKLAAGADGQPLLVSLGEKLLLPLLVKLTNFVPEGGIWLNTQRPEWNDANNALAGWGLSMVTVAHARRYLALLQKLCAGGGTFRLTEPVATLLGDLTAIFRDAPITFDDASRYRLLVALGRAGERHRNAVYSAAAAPEVTVEAAAVFGDLVGTVLPAVDSAIRASRRDGGLFDGYNVLVVEGERARVRHLYPMLEGQVAALDSGLLAPVEALEVVRALRSSALYRADQKAYLLYPDRDLPPLLERNRIAGRPPIEDRRLFTPDSVGGWHFQADLRNLADITHRLDEASADSATRRAVLDLWEATFHHGRFTGRSRTFFMFEGLGSIYWHMVAKLLLAVQESFFAAEAAGDPALAAARADAYDEVRDGLGFRKRAEVYGAFPTDPYSHTPRHRRAQQPGMTGLVKEEILARWGELGVRAVGGRAQFAPRLLHLSEFSGERREFGYVDLEGRERTWQLPVGSLGFTFCGTPVCYRLADRASITLETSDGRRIEAAGECLPSDSSASIFGRRGEIARITVDILEAELRT
jgi:hypothetical protein